MTAPTVVLAAGGTGGHVFPAEALALALASRGVEPVLFTDRRGRDFGGDIAVERIHGGGIAGLGLAARVVSVGSLALGLFEALAKLRRLAPSAVVGFGGYASLPTVLAASLLGRPTLVHEQNAVLGRANRLLARRVDRIATAFAQVARVPASASGKITRVGMPVRPAFLPWREAPYAAPTSTGPFNLLVLGGSQGARVFAEVVPQAIARLDPALRRRLSVTQQCRPENLEETRAAYAEIGVKAELASFFTDVPERLAKAHLLIARSGASTVAELTAVGRPALLVPYPFAIDDHQTANARALAEAEAGWLVPQTGFTPEALAARLTAVLADPQALERMAARARAFAVADAADRLAEVVLALARGGAAPSGATRSVVA